jgi:hypothetical protein
MIDAPHTGATVRREDIWDSVLAYGYVKAVTGPH